MTLNNNTPLALDGKKIFKQKIMSSPGTDSEGRSRKGEKNKE